MILCWRRHGKAGGCRELVYNRKKDDEISISNYKLELLGVIALTLLCIVVNKYSVYVTIFVYMISFYRAEFTDEA